MLFPEFASRRGEMLILAASLASGNFLQKVKNQVQLQMARRGCRRVTLDAVDSIAAAAAAAAGAAAAAAAAAGAAAAALSNGRALEETLI